MVAIKDGDGAPVVGHPADPDEMKSAGEFEGEDDLQRVLQVIAEVVEEDIAEAAAEDHPEDRPDEVVLDQLRRIGILLPSDPVHDEEIGAGEGRQVHQAVVAQLEGADLEEVRAQVRREVPPGRDQVPASVGLPLQFLDVELGGKGRRRPVAAGRDDLAETFGDAVPAGEDSREPMSACSHRP